METLPSRLTNLTAAFHILEVMMENDFMICIFVFILTEQGDIRDKCLTQQQCDY